MPPQELALRIPYHVKRFAENTVWYDANTGRYRDPSDVVNDAKKKP